MQIISLRSQANKVCFNEEILEKFATIIYDFIISIKSYVNVKLLEKN